MAAMTVEERVGIIAEISTKGLDNLLTIKKRINDVGNRVEKQQMFLNKAMSGGAQQMIDNATQTNRLGKQYNSFGKTMSMPFNKWKQFNEQGGEFTSRGGKMANTMRRATHGLRGFRMEMLSIMFFGMNLSRFFTGLLKPVMELTGLTELWTTTLQMVFLPIGMMLLDFLMPLMMWLMNLSDKVKLWIGWMVIGGAVLGLVLFFVGMLSLGIGGLIMALGGLWGILSRIIPDVTVLGVNISSFIEAFLGIAIVKTLFSALKLVVTSLLATLLGLPFVTALLDDLGISVGENETLWGALKRKASEVLNTIKTKLGLEDEFTAIEGWIAEVKLAASDWLAEMRMMMEEMGINDLINSFLKLSDVVIKMAPDLETIASIMARIAKAIDTVMGWFSKETNLRTKGYFEEAGLGTRGYIPQLTAAGMLPYSQTQLGGGFKEQTILNVSPIYNINLSDKSEFEKMLDTNNKNLVDEINRMIGT